jgi:hypothetical protein
MKEKYMKNEAHFDNYSSFLFQKDHIKVNFYSFEEKLLYEKEFHRYKTINEILNNFLNQVNGENLGKYLNNGKNCDKNNLTFYIKNEEGKYEEIQNNNSFIIINQFDKNKCIESIQSTSEFQNYILNIYVKNEKKYINKYNKIEKNIEEYIINNTYLIGKPIINHFKYYLYNKKSQELKIIKYPKEQIKKLNLKCYSGISTYCNAINNLYIYEGNSDLNFLLNNNNLIQINLINNNINIISYKFPNRILHSMIFIPKCYLFIVGGKKTKNIIVYTIQEKNHNYELYPHGLPYEVLEPSLIYLNNKYLYAFENSTLDFHILRTDLINVEPWEEIKVKNNKYDIYQKFFGVIKNKNSILFLGGQMLNLFNNSSKKCFFFDYNEETIKRCQTDFKPLEFVEKTFIPIEKGTYFQLAEIKNDNKYIPKKVIFREEW